MHFNDWLSRRRIYTPDTIAVVDDCDDCRYSYADLDARANRAAHHLRTMQGVKPGDRVACISTNRLEYLDLYFACGKLGAVLTPINHRLPAAAVVELLADCEPTLLIYETAFAEVAEAAARERAVLRRLAIDDDGASTGATFRDVVREAGPEPRIVAHPVVETDVAMILYTSGTTGRAKGAMISYGQIHWNALNTIIGLRLTEDDTCFLNMPLYHTGGWHVLFTPLMLLGGRVVLQRQFDAARCNELLGPEGITILFGVPTMLRMMLEAANFAAADLSSVRFAIFGGETCPLPVIEAYAARGVAMRQGYGLTEAGPNCFSLPADDAVAKLGSIGFPNFLIGTRLVKDDGGDADVDEVGELWMRGPHVFAGYWGNPDETVRAMPDGWLATGDLMRRDVEGYYYVVGRKKDMYVSGGENVYPAHVERVLQQHESVAQAGVVGVPDPKWGETGWAFVKLHPDPPADEPTLLAWCRQHLAKFQCPTRILILPELPLGHSGKIDKLALRELAANLEKS